MKNNPLIISLLVGLIVVLVIAGVSVSVKMNGLSRVYKKELAKNISLEKQADDLKGEVATLNKTVEELTAKAESLEKENEKLSQLNKTLEDNLKEELMKNKLGAE